MNVFYINITIVNLIVLRVVILHENLCRCNHNRPRLCILGPQWFAWLIVSYAPDERDTVLTKNNYYDPTVDYITYLLGGFPPRCPPNTDVFLINPPIYACDAFVHVSINATVEG